MTGLQICNFKHLAWLFEFKCFYFCFMTVFKCLIAKIITLHSVVNLIALPQRSILIQGLLLDCKNKLKITFRRVVQYLSVLNVVLSITLFQITLYDRKRKENMDAPTIHWTILVTMPNPPLWYKTYYFL